MLAKHLRLPKANYSIQSGRKRYLDYLRKLWLYNFWIRKFTTFLNAKKNVIWFIILPSFAIIFDFAHRIFISFIWFILLLKLVSNRERWVDIELGILHWRKKEFRLKFFMKASRIFAIFVKIFKTKMATQKSQSNLKQDLKRWRNKINKRCFVLIFSTNVHYDCICICVSPILSLTHKHIIHQCMHSIRHDFCHILPLCLTALCNRRIFYHHSRCLSITCPRSISIWFFIFRRLWFAKGVLIRFLHKYTLDPYIFSGHWFHS